LSRRSERRSSARRASARWNGSGDVIRRSMLIGSPSDRIPGGRCRSCRTAGGTLRFLKRAEPGHFPAVQRV
jgi:hypothetical protein